MLNYRVLKNSDEVDVRPYEFEADFGESLLEEVMPEKKEELEPEETAEKEKAESEYEKALRRAEEILEEAREKAEEIFREAREGGYRQGYDEGHKDGIDQGRREAYEDMARKMEDDLDEQQNRMRQVIDSVTEEKEKILEQYLDDLKRVCLAISEKVIQTSLRSSGEVIKRMIVAATDKIKKTQWAKIYISKQDSEMIVKGDAQLFREMAHLTDNLKIVAMENEDPGTCIIELPDEIVDASVGTQLENIKDILNNARL